MFTDQQLVIIAVGAVFFALAWRRQSHRFFDALLLLAVVLFMDCNNGHLSCRKEPRWFNQAPEAK